MLVCPDPPPATVVLDPHDDLVHTRAALATHSLAAGRITVHPTPGTSSTACLAYDILAALDKPLPFPAHRRLDAEAAWATAAAWVLAGGVTHLTLLRAHFLAGRRLHDLLTLRMRTGVRLVLVCHRATVPPVIERALHGERCHVAEAAALLPEADPATQSPGDLPPRPLAGRWISLTALTTLEAVDDADRRCRCTAPPAEQRGFQPPRMRPITSAEVAHRLHSRAGYPHLAAELATAAFTAASTTQLATAHLTDLAADAQAITLHDPRRLRQGCLTHPVPPWARPLLKATAYLRQITAGTDGPLFTDPLHRLGLPCLTDFAETCKLRPPQPPRQGRRRSNRRMPPPQTVWPISNAHYYYPWAVTEMTYGCPAPPPTRLRRQLRR